MFNSAQLAAANSIRSELQAELGAVADDLRLHDLSAAATNLESAAESITMLFGILLDHLADVHTVLADADDNGQ